MFDGQSWKVPVADINTSLPVHIDGRHNDFPQLVLDARDRVWLFGRHRIVRQRDIGSETPLHRAAWEIWAATLNGDSWTTPYEVPFSAGRQDVRWGAASDGAGSLFAVWPTDNRDFSEFLYQHADIYAAKLPTLKRSTREPVLTDRPGREVVFHDLAPTEVEDLSRLRSDEIRSQGKTYKIYRGDTHRHTEISMDGNNNGSLVQAYRYALNASSLDYLLTSEHNHLAGPDNEYINWLLQQTMDIFTIKGRFQPFYGYERSIRVPGGHRNILLTKRGTPTLPMLPEELSSEKGATRLYEYLRGNGGIAISHTSATGMGTDWRDNDPEVEPLGEIFQGDRVSAEYEGAPLAAHEGTSQYVNWGFSTRRVCVECLGQGLQVRYTGCF